MMTPHDLPLTSQPVIRVAVLGAGRMGLRHLKTLNTLPYLQIVAVADLDAETAERGRALVRAERASTDIEATICSSDVDAVVIVTPTPAHASQLELAVREGKAVWCEKPVAMSLAETLRVAEIVRSTGAFVQLGFMRRFDPGYVAAKAKIEAGELGRLETFRALSRDTVPPSLEFLKTSGGLFLDMSVHDLDLARFLVGEVEEVHAWATVLIDERFTQADDVDTAVTLLRFNSGALGVMETTRRSTWGYDIRTEVAGAEAKVVVEWHQKTPMIYSKDLSFQSDHYAMAWDRFEIAYRRQFEAFFEALRQGRAPSPTIEDALETQRLAIAVTQSWREKRPVRVQDVKA